MKIIIPTKDSNPNLFSDVVQCPLDAEGFIIYNTSNKEIISLSLSKSQSFSFDEAKASIIQTYDIRSFVANSFCLEFLNMVGSENLDLWQCTSSTVKDTINIFSLGGSFLIQEKLLKQQGHEHNFPKI